MKSQEIPCAFAAEGEPLVGMVHVPEQGACRGVLAIVAGGPQYRGGCCRQLVEMARALSGRGIPVMRFDYRGLGDGAGAYRGFQHIGADLDAAIGTFMRLAPSVREVVLWGGCDAASAALLHGPQDPRVTGLILGNPYVHTEAGYAKVVVRHYYWRRIREKSFWLKLLGLRMNPLRTAASALAAWRLSRQKGPAAPAGALRPDAPFTQRMCAGAAKFRGRILLLMSGLSLVSKEFDDLVASSPEWTAAIRRPGVTRVDFPEADQAFSTVAAREGQIAAAIRWFEEWPQ